MGKPVHVSITYNNVLKRTTGFSNVRRDAVMVGLSEIAIAVCKRAGTFQPPAPIMTEHCETGSFILAKAGTPVLVALSRKGT